MLGVHCKCLVCDPEAEFASPYTGCCAHGENPGQRYASIEMLDLDRAYDFPPAIARELIARGYAKPNGEMPWIVNPAGRVEFASELMEAT